MLYLLAPVFLQIPSSTPNPGSNDSIDFSKPFDVIVFLVLPIVIIVLYLLWRKGKKQN